MGDLDIKRYKLAMVRKKEQSERNSDPNETEAGKNQIDNKVLILREHIVSRVSSYCPIGGHSVTIT